MEGAAGRCHGAGSGAGVVEVEVVGAAGWGLGGFTHVPAARASSSTAHARALSPLTAAIALVLPINSGLFTAALVWAFIDRARVQSVLCNALHDGVVDDDEGEEGEEEERAALGRKLGRMRFMYPIAVNQYERSFVTWSTK